MAKKLSSKRIGTRSDAVLLICSGDFGDLFSPDASTCCDPVRLAPSCSTLRLAPMLQVPSTSTQINLPSHGQAN